MSSAREPAFVDAPIFGLETEFAILFTPEPDHRRRPDGITIFAAISAAVLGRVRGMPAHHRKTGHFLENGAFLHYEGRPDQQSQGLLEYSTPECSSAREVALHARAGERLLAAALPEAERALAAIGHHGRITLGRNARDAYGNAYGCHENYQAADPISTLGRASFRVLRAALAALALPFLALHVGIRRGASFAYVTISMAVVSMGFVAELLVQLLPPLRPRAGRVSRRLDGLLAHLDASVRDPLIRGYGRFFHYLFLPLARLASVLLRAFLFRRVRESLPAFLATRIVFTGAGHVDRTGPGPIFRLSERAASIRSVARLYWRDLRPMIDLKNFLFEWGSATAPAKRLHVMASDSNMNEAAEYLKFGTTDLVLRLIAAGAFPPSLQLVDPVGALHAVSADPTLRQAVPLTDGRWLTALEIQKELLSACDALVRSQPTVSLQDAEVLRGWRQVLSDLAADPALAADRVDWVLKRSLVEEALGREAELEDLSTWRQAVLAAEQAGVELQGDGGDLDRLRALLPAPRGERVKSYLREHRLDPRDIKRAADLLYRAKKVDLKYHDICEDRGYFHRALAAGFVRPVFSGAQVEDAIRTPPAGTRAASRGEFVKRHHRDPRGRVNWTRGRAGGARLRFGA